MMLRFTYFYPEERHSTYVCIRAPGGEVSNVIILLQIIINHNAVNCELVPVYSLKSDITS